MRSLIKPDPEGSTQRKMAYYVYVSIARDEKVNVYSMDERTGALDLKHAVPLTGGPGGIAINPSKQFLYVARRGASQLASFAIDQSDGSLTHLSTIEEESDAVYITIDSTGKFVLTSSNGAGRASSYRIGDDGALVAPAASTVYGVPCAHSVQLDPSDRYAYVPHCITQNSIFQYTFDGETGQIAAQELSVLVPEKRLGPRHLRFHPMLDVMYSTDEQGNSISAYRVTDGRLSQPFQTSSTIPDDYDNNVKLNTTAQLRVHPSGKYLYAPNRGHDSIACFSIDSSSGELTLIGRVPTEDHVRGFDLDPQGKFAFAAGAESGRVAGYAINQSSGELTPTEVYEVGEAPMWVLSTELG